MSFRETSNAFNASLDKQTRLDQGIFFTPKKARDALFERLKGISAETILEPSFGTGELILDARVAFPDARIVGVEKNTDLYNSVITTVDANIDVHNADFLEWTGELVDLIIGNPPYFVIPKDKRYTMMMIGRPNIYILFLYKCLTQHLKPDGVLAFVIPTSIYNCSYYQPMRDYIRNHCEVLYVETLDKPGFFETGQDTTLLIIKNTPTMETNKYLYSSKTGKTFISPYAEELYKLTENTETLASLGIGVKTGSIVWNQIPDNMADQGTLLIHASNISNSALTLDNISKKTKKRQYVTGIDKPTIDGPVILTDRGYGNKFKLNAVLVDLRGFYAENHINVIYHKAPDHQTAQILTRVLTSFRDERTARFIQLFIGNGSMSATDLETIIPIF